MADKIITGVGKTCYLKNHACNNTELDELEGVTTYYKGQEGKANNVCI